MYPRDPGEKMNNQQEDADYIASVGVVDIVESLITKVLSQRPPTREAAIECML